MRSFIKCLEHKILAVIMPILQIRKVRQTELKPQIQEFLNGKCKSELWLTQCFLL